LRAYFFPGVVMYHAPEKCAPQPKPFFTLVCKTSHDLALALEIIPKIAAFNQKVIAMIEIFV